MTDNTAKASERVIADVAAIGSLLSDLSSLIHDLEADLNRDIVENAEGTVTPYDAASALFFIKDLYEHMDVLVKRVYHSKDRLEKNIVPNVMEKFNTDMVRIPELRRSFSVNEKISASLLDKEAGFKWLREIGQGDIITETVNAGTLSAFVRSLQLEQGIDPPEDVVKVSRYKTISINKYTPKG